MPVNAICSHKADIQPLFVGQTLPYPGLLRDPRVLLGFKEYLRQQAQRTFNALDADSNGYIERQEFCMVVEATILGGEDLRSDLQRSESRWRNCQKVA